MTPNEKVRLIRIVGSATALAIFAYLVKPEKKLNKRERKLFELLQLEVQLANWVKENHGVMPEDEFMMAFAEKFEFIRIVAR